MHEAASPGPPGRLSRSVDTFEALHRDTLARVLRDAENSRRVFRRSEKARAGRAEADRQLLARAGLDLGELDELETREEELLHRFLESVRPDLEGRRRDRDGELRSRAEEATLFSGYGHRATLLGADVITNLHDGEDASVVWLHDADQVRDLSDESTGSGWGCLVRENPAYPDAAAQWWYQWVPPADGSWWFWIVAAYSGFRVVRANDSWHNCKYAKAFFYYDVDVHQYAWRGPDHRTIIDRRGGNIDDAGEVSGAVHWTFPHRVKAGDQVTIKITATLDVYAQGGGSYAELNFGTGQANLLKAPVVVISPE